MGRARATDRRWRHFMPAGVMLAACLCAGAALGASSADIKALDAAVDGAHRSAEHKARDKYRHPRETLRFLGVRPDMTVVEVLPGGGWYTEILAPYLHDHGKLIEATYPANSTNPFMRRMAARFQKKLASDPDIYGRVDLIPFEPPGYIQLGPPQSADMVLTFRNMHDLVFANPHGQVTDAIIDRFFRAAYLALKPGGVLGIVAHRASPDQPVKKSFELGRLPRSYLTGTAERAGFRLAAESEVNANPADPRDVPVWYLPPSLRSPEGTKAHYREIGESDRMTLEFVKPGG